MKVNIKRAAELVGISRSTMYNHISQKGITVEPDFNGKPRIDVSELIRVYGDKVKIPDTPDDSKSDTVAHTKTQDPDTSDSTELKYIVKNLQGQLETLEKERERERQQARETIELLREQVERADSERQRLTAVLTDQRNEQEKLREREKRQEKKFEDIQEVIKELRQQQEEIIASTKKKPGFLGKLFR